MSRYRKYLEVVRQRPLWQASFYAVLSLVLLIILLLSALRPTLVTIAGLLGQINQEKALEQRMDEKIKTVQTTALEYQKIESRLPALDAALPDSIQWADFADGIYQTATGGAVKLQLISLSPSTNQKLPTGVSGMQFSVSATGSYSDLKNFAGSLAKLKRVLDWTSLTISNSKQSGLTLTASGVIGYMLTGTKP